MLARRDACPSLIAICLFVGHVTLCEVVRADPPELPVVCEDAFGDGIERWQPTDAKSWRLIDVEGNSVFSLFQQSEYEPPYRSPVNFSLLKDVIVGDFVLTVRLRSTVKDYDHRSLCLFFGYQDAAHFYYAHLGKKADDHANQVFIVNGAPRTKISTSSTPGTPWDDAWHTVRIARRLTDGEILVYFDNLQEPIMTAEDKTFSWGQVGIGSFDDLGDFDDFELRGVRVEKP